MNKNERTLLVDGDEYLYSTASGCEVECDWGDDLWTLHTDLGKCKELITERMDALKERFGTDKMILCLSDAVNFRKGVLPSYKSKRKAVRKPLGYPTLTEWMRKEYMTETMPGLEADDVMGILATRGDRDTIIVSSDKDMKTIPGKVFREGKKMVIEDQEADYWFLYQTLIGDVTDGYKGCPGIGPKSADKVLSNFLVNGDLVKAWDAVVAAYVKAGLTEADALQQARCARILRASDWDADNQAVKLWTPTK